jgi:hypothetical protein
MGNLSIIQQKLTPVERFYDFFTELDKEFGLGLSKEAMQSFNNACGGCHHDADEAMSISMESNMLIEYYRYSLTKIGYQLNVTGGIKLDNNMAKRSCDIKKINLMPLTFHKSLGTDNLFKTIGLNNLSTSFQNIAALTLNPFLSTIFDADVPPLALNLGWNTQNIPLLFADNEHRMIYIIKGFHRSNPSMYISVFSNK